MIERRYGEMTTYDTRAESHETVDKARRYAQIMECFDEAEELTAKECAVMLWEKGYTPSSERNYAAPRLTELSNKGIIEPVGKTKCRWTGKMVAVYRIRERRES